jgi:hypothetical protein
LLFTSLGAALLLGAASAPAASAGCTVSLTAQPKRADVGDVVTLTAGATGCRSLTEIVSDRAVAGDTRFACRGASTCKVRVRSNKAMLARFTARAKAGSRVVESETVSVRWTKPQAAVKPKKFTMTLKVAGRVVWKAVLTLATYKTVFTGGNPGMPNQVSLPGGTKITLTVAYDVPIPRGGNATIAESIFNYDAPDTVRPLCEATSATGKTGCSVTLTLRDPEPFRQATTFNGNGFDPSNSTPDPSIALSVNLLKPER